MIQFDEHIFQRGWFNHQLEKIRPFEVCVFSQGVLEAIEENVRKPTFSEEAKACFCCGVDTTTGKTRKGRKEVVLGFVRGHESWDPVSGYQI